MALSPSLRRYRDSRAIHVATLKRWRAALRSTAGNPVITVLAHMAPVEVKRDAVESAVEKAREALALSRLRYVSELGTPTIDDVGKRVRVHPWHVREGMSATGVLVAVDPKHTGMCSATVELDTGHARLGTRWAFALSDLKLDVAA